jgi:O-acetyl-ADP-ribose deacetylase (regulator of RNase III)
VVFDVCRGDLVKEPCDAVVNAANEWLAHGGGLAAVLARAGVYVWQDSKHWVGQRGKVVTGTTAWTRAGGRLQCHKVCTGR